MDELDYLKRVQESVIEVIRALQYNETDKAYTLLLNLEENLDEKIIDSIKVIFKTDD